MYYMTYIEHFINKKRNLFIGELLVHAILAIVIHFQYQIFRDIHNVLHDIHIKTFH